MKRILISAVLALALAGTTAFAAQSKTASAKPAPKTAAAETMSSTGTKKPAVKKRKKHVKKTTSSNAAGTMTGAAKKPAPKKGNAK